jgi:hypothetical protein
VLFEAADGGKLGTRDGIAAQVDRMMKDPRARSTLVGFNQRLFGTVKGGRFLTYDTAHNQLLVSILHLMGFRDQNTFGDPDWSGPLPGLVT